MSHHQITLYERERLVKLLDNGYSQRKVAYLLGFSQATISKEIQRNSNYKGKYIATVAHYKATNRRKKASSKPKKQCEENTKYIKEKLALYWSPEQISGRMRLENSTGYVCFKTIYRWILAGQISEKHKTKKVFAYHSRYLRLKRGGKSFGSKAKQRKSSMPYLPSIELRQPIDTFGHWECDLVAGHNRSGYLVTIVDRQTGVLFMGHTRNKTSESVNNTIIETLSVISKKHIKTITYDRGKEFFGYKTVENTLKNKSYFCHPNSPHEKGLNENTNGLLRQFFPRSMNFSTIKAEDIKRATSLINNRPRKKFGYKTTVEILRQNGLSKVITFA